MRQASLSVYAIATTVAAGCFALSGSLLYLVATIACAMCLLMEWPE